MISKIYVQCLRLSSGYEKLDAAYYLFRPLWAPWPQYCWIFLRNKISTPSLFAVKVSLKTLISLLRLIAPQHLVHYPQCPFTSSTLSFFGLLFYTVNFFKKFDSIFNRMLKTTTTKFQVRNSLKVFLNSLQESIATI